MEKIYRAVKYIRTSCLDDKLQYRDSVANQSKLIDGFLRTHPEIVVVSEKIDNGYSGVFFHRPAFKEMIAEIEAGHVDCVVVKDAYVKLRIKILQKFFQTEQAGGLTSACSV